MARNPLYPVSAGETAVDKLLNQTLPRIIADKEAANERQQVRDDALTQQSIQNNLNRDKFNFDKAQAKDARDEKRREEAFNNASVIIDQAESVTDPAKKAILYERAGKFILESGRNPSDFGIGETGAITEQIRGTIESDTSYDKHKIHLDPSTNQSSTEAQINKAYFAVAQIKNTLSDTNKTEFESFVSDWETIDDTRFDFYKRPEYAQSTIATIQEATKSSKITTDFNSVPTEFRKEIIDAIMAGRSGQDALLGAPTNEEVNAYYKANYNSGELANESGKLYLGEWYETLDKVEERTTYFSNIPIDQAVVDARNVVYAISVTKPSGKTELDPEDGKIKALPLEEDALRKAAVEFGIPEKVLLQIEDMFLPAPPTPVDPAIAKKEKARIEARNKKREEDKVSLYGGALQGGGMNANRWRSVKVYSDSPSNASRMKAEVNLRGQIAEYNKTYPEAKVTFEEILQLYNQSKKRK